MIDHRQGRMETPSDDAFSFREEALAERTFVDRVARRLARSRADADDLSQDIWLTVLSNKPELRSSLRPWLVTVAKRLRSNQRRSDTARETREVYYSRNMQEGDEVASTGFELAAQGRLLTAMRGLPPEASDLLRMRYEQDLSFSEIAAKLGIPEATARTRHHRIVQELRVRLEKPRRKGFGALLPAAWQQAWSRFLAALSPSWTFAGMLVCAGLWFGLSLAEEQEPLAGLAALKFSASSPLAPITEKGTPLKDEAPQQQNRSAGEALADAAALSSASPTATNLLVTNADGSPAPGIELFEYRITRGARDWVQSSLGLQSDANGRASLPKLRQGAWVVGRTPEGLHSQAVLVDFAAQASRQPTLVVKEPEARWDFQVFDANGSPASGVKVTVQRGLLNGSLDSRSMVHESKVFWWQGASNHLGRLTIPTIRARKKASGMLLEHPSYAPQVAFARLGSATLEPKRSLSGTVLDGEAKPQVGALITLRLQGTTLVRETRSGEDGSFHLLDAPVGLALLEVKAGALGTRVEMDLGASPLSPAVLEVRANSFTLGRLVDAKSQALGGWTLECLPPLHTENSLLSQAEHRRTWGDWLQTDSDGCFVTGLLSGPQRLLRAIDPETGDILATGGIDRTAELLQLMVKRGFDRATVHGSLELSLGSGRPATHVLAAHESWSEVRQVPLDRTTGAFRIDDVPHGELFLQPTGGSDYPHVTSHTIAGESVNIELGGPRNAALLRIVSPDYEPILNPVLTVIHGRRPRKLLASESQAKGIRLLGDGLVEIERLDNLPMEIKARVKGQDWYGYLVVDPEAPMDVIRTLVLKSRSIWPLKLTAPNTEGRSAYLRLETRDLEGALVSSHVINRVDPGSPCSLALRLPAGRYELTLDYSGGEAIGPFPFTIPQGDLVPEGGIQVLQGPDGHPPR